MTDKQEKEWQPGTGRMFYTPKHLRKSEMQPDFDGYLVLNNDYKAGEKLKLGAYEKKAQNGNTYFVLREDQWAKQRQKDPAPPRGDTEVKVTYNAPAPRNPSAYKKGKEWDEDVPF